MAKIRKCQDCKFSVPSKWFFIFNNWDFAKCGHPKLVRTKEFRYRYHLGISPKNVSEMHYCETMRSPDIRDSCGAHAVYFEPREENK